MFREISRIFSVLKYDVRSFFRQINTLPTFFFSKEENMRKKFMYQADVRIFTFKLYSVSVFRVFFVKNNNEKRKNMIIWIGLMLCIRCLPDNEGVILFICISILLFSRSSDQREISTSVQYRSRLIDSIENCIFYRFLMISINYVMPERFLFEFETINCNKRSYIFLTTIISSNSTNRIHEISNIDFSNNDS